MMIQKVNSFTGNEDAYGGIPSLIGCFIADKAGMTLFTFEIYEGALEQYLKASVTGEKKKKQFDIEVIPMFMSALERFSKSINIQEVPEVSLCGRNLRMQALFNFEDYIIIFLLHPEFNWKSIEHEIIDYFAALFEKFEPELHDFSKRTRKSFKLRMERLGKRWLLSLNQVP